MKIWNLGHKKGFFSQSFTSWRQYLKLKTRSNLILNTFNYINSPLFPKVFFRRTPIYSIFLENIIQNLLENRVNYIHSRLKTTLSCMNKKYKKILFLYLLHLQLFNAEKKCKNSHAFQGLFFWKELARHENVHSYDLKFLRQRPTTLENKNSMLMSFR